MYERISPILYNPQYIKIRRVGNIDVGVDNYCACLGYTTYEITQTSLNNTTWIVQTLQSESREQLRDYDKTRV